MHSPGHLTSSEDMLGGDTSMSFLFLCNQLLQQRQLETSASYLLILEVRHFMSHDWLLCSASHYDHNGAMFSRGAQCLLPSSWDWAKQDSVPRGYRSEVPISL